MKSQQHQIRLNDQLCFLLYAASRNIVKAYQPILKPFGLTYPQYLVLMVLWEKDGLSIGDLGMKLQLDSGTLSPLIKRLQAKALISKKRDPNDERLVHVHLTAAGRKVEKQAHDVPKQIAKVAQLARGEGAQLFEILGCFNERFAAEDS